MSATHVASKIIKEITKGDKSVIVKIVNETTSWTRLSPYPDKEEEEKFCNIAAMYIDDLDPKTKAVSMK